MRRENLKLILSCHIGVSLVVQLVKNPVCNAEDPSSIPWLGISDGEGIGYPLQCSLTSLVAQLLKNPPVTRETWVGKIPWRRERVSTPVFWPGESHGLYSPWGHKELTQLSNFHFHFFHMKTTEKSKIIC